MKRKIIKTFLTCSCVMMLVGCGQLNGQGDSLKDLLQTETKEDETMKSSAELKEDGEEVKSQESDAKDNDTNKENEKIKEEVKEEKEQEKHTMEGSLSEKKDFMFILEDSDKKPYAFAFTQKPEGYDELKVGDYVSVEYSGELSETEAFTGEVFSVKTIEQK